MRLLFPCYMVAQTEPVRIQLSLELNSDAEILHGSATVTTGPESTQSSLMLIATTGLEISFTTDLAGATGNFHGTIMHDSMAGTMIVREGDAMVASGTWSVLRQHGSTAGGFAGRWTGEIIATPVPDQRIDSAFHPSVIRPAWKPETGPRLLFDEAHHNMHRAEGLYSPFAQLLQMDGIRIEQNADPIDRQRLDSFDLLVIANAMGPRGYRDSSAFTAMECDAIADWVRSGGALLLIADHFPMGDAVRSLAALFGVAMSGGYVDDTTRYDPMLRDILFTPDNGGIGNHPVMQGRDTTERIDRIVTFTGQALTGPSESVPLLQLGDNATDYYPPTKEWRSVAHQAQALALAFGKGRVVVMGEAAMLTAQIDRQGNRFGMNVPGIDNRQLALNIVHWLVRLF
jgi:hypothetical protein